LINLQFFAATKNKEPTNTAKISLPDKETAADNRASRKALIIG
jgi:hypothetical protein